MLGLKGQRTYWGILLVSILSFGILYLVFTPIFQHPNAYLFGTSPDAIKNYFNVDYFIRFDNGIRHDGINYPYGDLLFFLDSQPGLTWVLSWVDQHLFPLKNHVVGVLNLLMILSLVGLSVFLFLILRFKKVRWWPAIFFALCITFLSPQIDRIHGHLALSYAFCFACSYYLLLIALSKKKVSLSLILLIGFTFVTGFLHPYHLAIFTVFATFVSILIGIKEYFSKKFFVAISAAIVPLFLYYIVLRIFDTIPDRPSDPYGFFTFYSSFASVFLPEFSAFSFDVSQLVDVRQNWEARAFIGSIPSIFFFSLLGIGAIKMFNRKISLKDMFSFGSIYIWSALLTLLFSMCIPFKWVPELIELFPVIKQFRALGRFNWVFYYVFSVFTVSCLLSWINKTSVPSYLKNGSIALLVFIWFSEGLAHLLNNSRPWYSNDKLEATDANYSSHFNDSKFSVNDFQCILPLPYYAQSGDKLLFERGYSAISEAIKCSHHTGIPLINSLGPRNSLHQSLSGIQLIGHHSIPKFRINDFDKRSILLLCTTEEKNDAEINIINHATLFYSDEYISLYALPPYFFYHSNQDWINFAQAQLKNLDCSGRIICTENPELVYFNSYPDESTKGIDAWGGSFAARKGKHLIGYTPLLKKTAYRGSIWMFIDGRKNDMPKLEYEIIQTQGVEKQRINTRSSYDIYKNWVKIPFSIEPYDEDVLIKFFVAGQYIKVDHLLVQPAGQDVFCLFEGENWLNGYPIVK